MMEGCKHAYDSRRLAWNNLMKTILLASLLTVAATAQATDYYVAPDGNDHAVGTKAAPLRSIMRAQQAARAGDTVYFRGGVYAYTSGVNSCATRIDTVNAITLDNSGSEGRPIRYWAYPGETPVFDFSAMKDDCRVKGFNVTGSWLHLKGLEVTGVPQQPENHLNHESWGIWNNGSHNVFERLNLHHNMGPGLFIQNGGYNQVLNTDSHHNYDPYTSNGAGQSADGFGAHIKAGHPGNVFRGCRAWANSDDGFDLINAFSPVIIENSWAWQQGYLPGTLTKLEAGNGNGIKAGGYGGKYVPNGVRHIIRNSVAFDNKAAGFYANHHPLALDFINNTAFSNGADYNMAGIAPDGSPTPLGNLLNNIAYRGRLTINTEGLDMAHNSWTLPAPVTDADFDDVSDTGWDAPRQPDGSLPVLRSFHLKSGSRLAGMGAFTE
ncbi:Pectate lyase [Pseudomonas syringae pv. tagetis]|uniref:Pectate lyase n=5 Tax=Pseudomonas syringae group genomosp. 7 TaxID=251699 RepID=A0A0Q0H472_9PSED|nr:Pectate lyase [Pseudomonas syringae pv. tagetis]RMR09537.1 Pectate lyase [Pseudomonas syringae pv. helianthi]RMW15796.1 Pectate lyase [Pseudomonas syringae pv. tagetis]RMW26915.1 Pectate lyase [Pseudomonas syringae pv. tagetis]